MSQLSFFEACDSFYLQPQNETLKLKKCARKCFSFSEDNLIVHQLYEKVLHFVPNIIFFYPDRMCKVEINCVETIYVELLPKSSTISIHVDKKKWTAASYFWVTFFTEFVGDATVLVSY